MDKVIAASLKLDSKDANQSVKSFKTELREANENLINIQQNFGPLSKEAISAAKRVAELKDSMQDAREVSDLFDPGAKFQAFGNVVRTVAGGMTALTGTMALFGDESEDVQKALLKVQGALAITEGLNTLFDSLKDFERLGAILKTNTVIAAAWNFVQSGSLKLQQQNTVATIAHSTATKGQTAAMIASATATGGVSVAMKVLRAAMIATGIGAIVVGLIALYQNFDKVKAAVEKLIGPLDGITKFFGKLIDKVTDFVGATSDASRATDRMVKDLKKSLSDSERFLDLNADKYDQYTQKKLQADLDYKKKRLGFLEDEALSEGKRNELVKQALAQRNRIINAADTERATAQRKMDEEAAEKFREAEKKRIEAAKKAAEELRKITLDTSNFESETAMVDLNRVKKQNEEKTTVGLAAIGNDFFKRQELQIELDGMAGQYSLSEFERQQLELEMWYAEKYKLAKEDGLNTTALTAEFERQKTEITKAENERRLSLVGNILGQAATLFGKHTAAGKTMAIAQATIDTYQSAVSAYKAGLSAGGPLGLALGPISAGLAIAAGLKNIREIAKVKAPGGGGGGASVPSISTDAPLRPQRPQESNTRLPQDQINQIGNAAQGGVVRAFIVDRDAVSGQEKLHTLQRAAKLGG